MGIIDDLAYLEREEYGGSRGEEGYKRIEEGYREAGIKGP